MGLDISKLNSFSQEVYYRIIQRHPEWDKYAKHDEELNEFIVISIPALTSDSFDIDIVTLDGEEDEITIYYGPPHFHLFMYRPFRIKTLDDQIEAVEEIIQKIFSEELISFQKKSGLFGFVTSGIATPEKYNKLLETGKLDMAVSWKGTYNYPRDGTHINWVRQVKSE